MIDWHFSKSPKFVKIIHHRYSRFQNDNYLFNFSLSSFHDFSRLFRKMIIIKKNERNCGTGSIPEVDQKNKFLLWTCTLKFKGSFDFWPSEDTLENLDRNATRCFTREYSWLNMKDTTLFQSKIITYFTYAKVKSENSDFKKTKIDFSLHSGGVLVVHGSRIENLGPGCPWTRKDFGLKFWLYNYEFDFLLREV